VRYRHPVGGRLRSDGGPPHEVPGVVQVFRREVLDAVGGYEALPHGGEDTVANARARALGWTTRVVDGVEVVQRRRQGSVAAATRVRRLARAGRCDHDLGTLPTYEVLKAVRRLGEPPVVLGATARLVAYAADAARRRPPLASPAAVAQLRAEQRALLRDWRRWRRR
jgi:GT2 family glycosyltransferase